LAEIIFTSHDDKSLTSILSNSRRSDDSDNGCNISGSDEKQNDDENEIESGSESGDGKEVVFVKGKSDTGDDCWRIRIYWDRCKLKVRILLIFQSH